MNTTMFVATGSLEQAGKEMDFVRDLSERLGLQLREAAKGFAGIAAAANGTSLEGEKIREVYEGVSTAVAALSLSADDTRGVMTALTQIISKGTVSSDELKQQLGERLPGAFQIAARSMGVTTAELSKMLEQGKIVSEDFLPKFANELKKTFGPAAQLAAESYTANMARLKNRMFELRVEVGQQLLPVVIELVKQILELETKTEGTRKTVGSLTLIYKSFAFIIMGVAAAFTIAGAAVGEFAAGALNVLEQNARKIRKAILQFQLLKIAVLEAAASLETMNFKQADQEAFHAGQKFRDLLETIKEGTVPVSLSIVEELERASSNIDKIVKKFGAIKDLILNGPITPPPPDTPDTESSQTTNYLHKYNPFLEPENFEPISKDGQKIIDSIRKRHDAIFLSKEELLKKEFEAEATNITKVLGGRAEETEAIKLLRENLSSELTVIDEEASAAEIERLTALSELKFELGLAGLDAETEQAAIAKELRDQQFEEDMERIEKLAATKDEKLELEAAAKKAFATQEAADQKKQDALEASTRKKNQVLFANSLGNMASASAAFFGEQSAAYKVFAIGEAITSTYLGAANVLADKTVPFWLKAFAVSSIVASGLASVAQISGVAHGGLTEVPSDQTFLLKQGERVLSPDQNEDFTEFIGGGGGGGRNGMIDLTINIDGQPLYSGISKASRDGRFTISARAVA